MSARAAAPLGAALHRLLDLSFVGLGADFRLFQSSEEGAGSSEEGARQVKDKWGPLAVGRALAGLPKLKVLDMTDCALNRAGCVAVVQALVSAGRQLQECTLGSVDYTLCGGGSVAGSAEVLNQSWVRIEMYWSQF